MPRHSFVLLSLSLSLVLCLVGMARADGPADNLPDKVRRVPQLGIEVPPADAQELQALLDQLGGMIQQLRQPAQFPAQTEFRRRLLPDVEIYYKAVHDALTYREFFNPKELANARDLLREGIDRAKLLLIGEAPWEKISGLVVRGYVSRIDGSVQPYGLVIPDSYNNAGLDKVRLDIWCHGRGETLSEVNFLTQRKTQVGQIAPTNTIVLHPYGRYCNAFKFAGEVDVLEALESVRSRYRIDDRRVNMRGFSMGGAACWQFAVHYADRWAAATPGAGFSETPEFLKIFQQETLKPTWYEQKLWHLYDCPNVAVNLYQCPTIAYSGELDIQKQAADVMQRALQQEGIELVHLIGPQTKHSYHPQSLRDIEQLLASISLKGLEVIPSTVHFETYTLKYNRMNWVTVDGLGEHWSQARVDAHLPGGNAVTAQTKNVTDLTLSMPAGWAPFDLLQPVQVTVDGQKFEGPKPTSDRAWEFKLHQTNGMWQAGPRAVAAGGPPRKAHDLQGPIDDAFMESFVFVRPTGKSAHPAFDAWAKAEFERAIERWRRQFRGQARVINDTEVNDAVIAGANLVLWGDPASNAVLNRIAPQLPIRWDANQITAGERSFPSDQHALIMIYPNPLNPQRYVVLNSGFTYREYDDLNNARQVPKLPDWAVIDLRTPPNSRFPGKIVDADFFGENWELRPPHE